MLYKFIEFHKLHLITEEPKSGGFTTLIHDVYALQYRAVITEAHKAFNSNHVEPLAHNRTT